ncbi:MAG: nucleoside-diphosphate kinase [bacterium]|nr:nucleoside-diphosphate kinase [bacterium]
MTTHPKKERTFVAVKHDGIQRSLVGEIVKRIERVGLKIVAMKMFVPDMERTVKHYGKDDVWCEKKGSILMEAMINRGETPTMSAVEYGRGIIKTVYDYFTMGPVIAMVIEGNHAVAIVKKLTGDTNPSVSDVGTIRGDFTLDSYETANLDNRAVRTILHCTDKPEGAEREINIWFKPEEIINYRLVQEEILYDVNLDGILE